LLNDAGVDISTFNRNFLPQDREMITHYPEKIIGKGKRCKLCYFKFGSKCSVSKIRCGKCSDGYEKDINLCTECFEEFHEDPGEFLQGHPKKEDSD